MDDNEYYEKMRNRNLNRGFTIPKRKNSVSKNVKDAKSDFKDWSTTQGREDAEMLYERKHEENDE